MEFEAIDEIIEVAEDGMDDAAEESEMSPEELEEFNEEVAEAKENIESLGKDVEEFKKFSVTESLKKFGLFLGKTAAIGSIFFGVNLGLSKLVKLAEGSTEKKKSYQRKLDVVKAISALIKTETDMSKKLLDWMKEHKDDTITLDGIEVPVESVFHKYLGPISDAVDKAFDAAKPLQTKIDAKVSWLVPTAEDVGKLLDASAAYVKAFDDLRKFAVEQSSKFPVLKTLPLTEKTVDDLRNQMDVAKAMPFY